jgi:hypothetical protein
MEDAQEDARAGEEALLALLSLPPTAAALLAATADAAALRAVSRRVRAQAAVHDRWRDAAVARHALEALMASYERGGVVVSMPELAQQLRELARLRMVCRAWRGRIGDMQMRYNAALFARTISAVTRMGPGDATPPPPLPAAKPAGGGLSAAGDGAHNTPGRIVGTRASRRQCVLNAHHHSPRTVQCKL